MSRHGYSEDGPEDVEQQWANIRYQGALASAVRGKRGQKFFRDLIEALDAMPVKELHETNVSGDCLCAMGALAAHRKVDLSKEQAELDDEDGDHLWATETVGDKLGIASALAREVAYQNDENPFWNGDTPASRWGHMRRWAEEQMRESIANTTSKET